MHWSDSFRLVPTGSTWYRSELIGLGTGRTDRFHWFRSESGWKNWRNFLLFGLYCDPKFPIGIQPVPTGSDRNLRGTAKTSSIDHFYDLGQVITGEAICTGTGVWNEMAISLILEEGFISISLHY